MCYFEITDNINVNRKFLRIVGPTTATYFSMLAEILKQVKVKNKFDPTTGLWKLDRKYVFSETGINTDDQKKSDTVLFRLGIITKIDPENPDRLAVDVKRYFELLTDDSLVPEDLLPKTQKLTATEQKQIKKASIKKAIVNRFGYESESEIAAIIKLVDVYYDKGYCKFAQWDPVITMFKACAKDSDAVVKLVDEIIATNYQSIPAAIDSFMKKQIGTATKLNTEQKKNTGTMAGVEF